MSYNIAINMFGDDSSDSVDPRETTFQDFYNGNISNIIAKFARRYRETIPVDANDLDEKEGLWPVSVELGADILDAAARDAATYATNLTMKHLYVKNLYDAHIDELRPLLLRLSLLLRVNPWVCIPFMNYSWTTNDDPYYPRPDEAAYRAHLEGDVNPYLPSGKQIGGDVLDVRTLDYNSFTYFDTTNQPSLSATYWRTRLFASEWGFLDAVDIVERQEWRIGSSQAQLNVGTEILGGVSIRSSGNGYRCVGGICKADNPSAFCVSSSCP